MYRLKTPVVFIVFNRPDLTAKIFSEIAKAKPAKLLLISDGARKGRVGEAEKVAATRAIIKRVNWNCEVLTNFSDVNLGCKKRISSGIDWVFENVQEAIILEDDCLPSISFFQFCDEMLEKYREEKSIGMIGGVNFQMPQTNQSSSYYFSKYTHIWGWATWRDRWVNYYDVDLKLWPQIKKSNSLKSILGRIGEYRFWSKIFDRVHGNKIDTWDYQWLFTNWISCRINILPSINLISNIGFGRDDATHTKGISEDADLPRGEILFPLTHPQIMEVNHIADTYSDTRCFRTPLHKRLIKKGLYFLQLPRSIFSK